MRTILLTSVALIFVAATSSFAAVSTENQVFPAAKSIHTGMQMLADGDGDGGGKGGGGDDSADDGGDDRGGADKSDDKGKDDAKDDDDRDGDKDKDKSKARVPGGKGCDSARDRAEHPGCK
jgi:hypothetical protein